MSWLAAVFLHGIGCPATLAHAQTQSAPAIEPAAKSPKLASRKPRITPGSDPGGVAVAIIGSGVNYTLPLIASRLGRDGEGDIIGLDFIDRDNKPFDVAGAATPGGPGPSGTTLASIVLTEAPRARLVSVRARLDDPRQIGGAASFAASTPARVAAVAFANPGAADLDQFRRVVAAAAPRVLFVVGAGDAGARFDEAPPHPASKELANSIVVTAADDKGALLPTANRGTVGVDIAVTAHAVPGVTAGGGPTTTSGTLAASARVAALVARLLAAEPALSPANLKARIVGLAKPIAGETKPSTQHGFIDATGMATGAKP